MPSAPLPPDESGRLQALRRLAILDTPAEERFDRITRLAAALFHVPIALVSLVDANRQWFKSCIGLPVNETDRSVSFCAHAILGNDVFVIPDARADVRFADNGLVTGEPFIRFYAGQPLQAADGSKLGTLCVIDRRPHQPGPDLLARLRDLAHLVEQELSHVDLHLAHDRLAAVLRAATRHSIIGTDPDGVVTVFNEGAEHMLGYSASEVVGRQTPELFHDRAEVAARAAELGIQAGFEVFVHGARAGGAETREWTYLRRDGQRLTVSLTVAAMVDQDGAVEGFIGVATDITEHKAVVAELAESERRYRELVELADEGIWSIDEDNRTTFVNRRMAEMLGHEPGEMVGRPLFDYLDEEGRAVIAARLERRRAGEADAYEFRFRRRDGADVWVTINTKPLADHSGRYCGAVAMITDITERRRAEQSLRASEERFRALVQHASDGVVVLDARGVIRYASPAAYRLVGTDNPADLGASVFDALHPDDAATAVGAFQAAVANPGVAGPVELRVRRADGAYRWVEVVANSLLDLPSVQGIVLNLRDVTERREIQQLKDEIVSVVSHELRTPLTSIRGSLGLLAGGIVGELPDEARHMVDVAVQNAERLGRLVDDVLDLARIDAGIPLERKPWPVADLFDQALAATAGLAASAGVTLAVDDPPAVELDADGDRIVQVLVNLLSNAVKFSPPGAAVAVEAAVTGDDLTVRIRDAGRGIPPERLGRIFERFEQVDASDARQKGGTGLGLAIAQSIVTRHGGRIGVESMLGEGSTFWFTIPLARGEARA